MLRENLCWPLADKFLGLGYHSYQNVVGRLFFTLLLLNPSPDNRCPYQVPIVVR